MVLGLPYETVEEYFGPGDEYSADLLNESDDRDVRRMGNLAKFLVQVTFFTDHGCYPIFMPEVNPTLVTGRRYLLSGKSYDPKRSYMAHTFVVDEYGKVFDPDPNYDPSSPKYSVENYPEIIGWEVVRLAFLKG
jgi:hypothetical protein